MANNLPNQLVVSVYGPHAGENEMEILHRKMEDIRKVGFTMWFYGKSNRFARPDDVQIMAKQSNSQGSSPQMWLIHPSVIGGAQATSKPPVQMREYSADGQAFHSIDQRLTPVTGGNDGFAFVIEKIELVENKFINLGRYADPSNSHIGFKIGNSTQIVRAYDSPPKGVSMKRPSRAVWAVFVLKDPFCVYVR